MNVVWRRKARAEIETIVARIAQDSPSGAARVRDRILASVSLLEMWPDIGRAGRIGLRELVVTRAPYVVLYRRAPNKITIVRVLHAMRKR